MPKEISMSHDQLWASTLQKANVWMKELAAELGLGMEDTLLAFRTVSHALRDRLPPPEAAQLAASFPLLLKGVYFDGWKLGATPVKIRTTEEFLAFLSPPLARGTRNVNVEEVTRTVFRFIAHHIAEGEVEQIRGVLPERLRELWPEHSAARGSA
jgi:uncharacterized protein (DUF2267 family)